MLGLNGSWAPRSLKIMTNIKTNKTEKIREIGLFNPKIISSNG